MSRRAPLRLEALGEPVEAPKPKMEAPPATAPSGPERTTTIYVRAPWSLAERLKDLARTRSKQLGRRVTMNELAIEALSKLA